MNFLLDSYQKSLIENDKNQKFWENYLDNLKSLDFRVFADKLKVPILVPIGSRILFRGELLHTNEITVALGADYFAKCSVKQAEVLREHRIKDAESKLEAFQKERKYLESRLSFGKEQVLEKQECEISEFYSEEELRIWKEKHRQNVKEYKQTRKEEPDTFTDDELWNRLEELELQEELENELQNNTNSIIVRKGQRQDDLREKQDNYVKENRSTEQYQYNISNGKANPHNRIDKSPSKKEKENHDEKENQVEIMETIRETPKLDLLQQVLVKQCELEDKLLELKTRERSETKTESDLLSRLDEIEELDDLEDEMNRLDDILQSEDVISEEDEISSNSSITKKSVTFADDEVNETIEVTFKHSSVLPCKEPYDPDKGILKPSDVYEAFPKQFKNETSSILKKSKYQPNDKIEINDNVSTKVWEPQLPEEVTKTTKRVTLNDIVEKTSEVKNEIEIKETRPMSLFKKKRLQRNS